MGTVITTGDQPAAPAFGFNAAQVAVEPVDGRCRSCSPTSAPVEPSGSVAVVGAAVRLTCCCPKAAPAPRRRTVAREYRSLIRIDLRCCWFALCFSSALVGFVDHEFPGIDQHHHQHSAGENVVGGDLALVVRVPHKGPAALVGGFAWVLEGCKVVQVEAALAAVLP